MIKPQLQPKYKNGEQWLRLGEKWNAAMEVIELSTPTGRDDVDMVNWYADCEWITSFHGAFIDVNPASNDPDIRKIGQARCRDSCLKAKMLGASNVVFHSAAFPHLKGHYLDKWVKETGDFYKWLIDRYHLNIFVENSADPDPEAIKRLIKSVNDSRIKACLDIGHANFSGTPIKDWFSELGDSIGYLHISDNMGLDDDHLEIGKGNIDWDEVSSYVSELKGDIPATLEVGDCEAAEASFRFLSQNGYLGFGHGGHEQVRHQNVSWKSRLFKDTESLEEKNELLEDRNKFLFDTFSMFLSDDIARQVIDQPGGDRIQSEERELTVLMSDLRGFTALCEQYADDAESLTHMINHYLSEMLDVISSYGGTVLEFLGDGITAIFGAPSDDPNHASNAIAAAVAMQNRLPQINSWNRVHGYPDLMMGIGINSGLAIIGIIGSERHAKYGVIGRVINLCSRIETYTVGGQILVSPYTMNRVHKGDPVVTRTIEVFPKGVPEPITVSDVTGMGEPYNVSCERDAEELRVLKKPVHITYRAIKKNRTSLQEHDGIITQVSSSEAVIVSDHELKMWEELRIGSDRNLTVKVTEIGSKGTRVSFTTRPKGFEKWIAEME